MANVKVLPDELIASGEYVKKILTDTEENYNIVISSELSGSTALSIFKKNIVNRYNKFANHTNTFSTKINECAVNLEMIDNQIGSNVTSLLASADSLEFTEIKTETFNLKDLRLTSDYKFTEVPLYNQKDYNDPYGQYGTVSTHGCGITSVAMVATYLLDNPNLTPDVLAKQFGRYNTEGGSAWSLFGDSAKELGIGEVKQVFWGGKDDVIEALKNHQPVICSMKGGKFTSGGHFIVLTGITEDGKILVNDPYGGNYNNPRLQDGFENGFDFDTDIRRDCQSYFIYPSKEEVMKEKEQQNAA